MKTMTMALMVAAMLAAPGCVTPEAESAESTELVAQAEVTPEVQALAHSSFAVDGMTCDGCVNGIQRTCQNMEGVAGTELTLEDAVLTVYWADGVTPDPAAIEAEIESLGYTLTPVAEGSGAAM